MKKIISISMLAFVMVCTISVAKAQYSTNQQYPNGTVYQTRTVRVHHDNGKHKGWYKHNGNNGYYDNNGNWQNGSYPNRGYNSNQPVYNRPNNGNVRRGRDNEEGNNNRGRGNERSHGKKDKERD